MHHGHSQGGGGGAENEGNLTHSFYNKTIYQQKIRKLMDNIKPPPKTSITQRLQTDLGRSVGVTTVIQLVWLNRITGTQPSRLPQKPCNQKDKHIKIL